MTLEEFSKITDPQEILKIQQVKKFIEKRNYIGKYKFDNILEKTYKEVDELKDLYVNGDVIGLVLKALDVEYKDIAKVQHTDFMYFLVYMEQQVENILKMEQKLNEPDDNDDGLLAMCGVEKLEKYGSLNVIDNLANGNMLKWDEIENLPYSKIYTKLMMEKDKSSIQRAYHKIKTKSK